MLYAIFTLPVSFVENLFIQYLVFVRILNVIFYLMMEHIQEKRSKMKSLNLIKFNNVYLSYFLGSKTSLKHNSFEYFTSLAILEYPIYNIYV